MYLYTYVYIVFHCLSDAGIVLFDFQSLHPIRCRASKFDNIILHFLLYSSYFLGESGLDVYNRVTSFIGTLFRYCISHMNSLCINIEEDGALLSCLLKG